MRFDLETEVRFPDGERAGILRRVVMGENGQIDSVVIATDELISRNLIVPASAFSEAPGNVLQIELSRDQLREMPDYEEELMPSVPEGWTFEPEPIPGADVFPATLYEPIVPVVETTNLPEGLVAIGQGTEVDCLDGRWGVVDEVLSSEEGQITAFIGRPDDQLERDRLIPIGLVSEFGPDTVMLNCTLADLATYSEELATEAEEPEME